MQNRFYKMVVSYYVIQEKMLYVASCLLHLFASQLRDDSPGYLMGSLVTLAIVLALSYSYLFNCNITAKSPANKN